MSETMGASVPEGRHLCRGFPGVFSLMDWTKLEKTSGTSPRAAAIIVHLFICIQIRVCVCVCVSVMIKIELSQEKTPNIKKRGKGRRVCSRTFSTEFHVLDTENKE